MKGAKAEELVSELMHGIMSGNRSALARAITLVESDHPADIENAELLLEQLAPSPNDSMRIGISGSPGVGKSTLIESLALFLLAKGHHVAVLTIDPSSPKTKGSVLGDKTRMPKLSVDARAFVRPSASGGVLGGVTARTAESIRLCESAGYKIILVETIGVGQNEIAVAELVDLVLLLLDPAAGDDLQGIKRGVVEFADIIAVNKSDDQLVAAASRVRQQYENALSLFAQSPLGPQQVLTLSARDKIGLEELWMQLEQLYLKAQKSGLLLQKRAAQSEQCFWRTCTDMLLKRFKEKLENQKQLNKVLAEVRSQKVAPSRAARIVLGMLK